MPVRETTPTGAPTWVDLMTSDVEASRAFYCELFGWTAEEPAEEFGGYFSFRKDGVRMAGCMAQQSEPAGPDVWSVYLTTDDAEKTLEAASANGGEGVGPAVPGGGLGGMGGVSGPPGGAGRGV